MCLSKSFLINTILQSNFTSCSERGSHFSNCSHHLSTSLVPSDILVSTMLFISMVTENEMKKITKFVLKGQSIIKKKNGYIFC